MYYIPATIKKIKTYIQYKNNKAVGIDSLPIEVLKNNASCELLKCLFHKICVIHVIPSAWKRAIIKPIPKIQILIADYHCNIGA